MAEAEETEEEGVSTVSKAAVVLMSLGRELASDVMKYLSEAEVKKLSRAFVNVQEVERDQQRVIAAEFQRMLRASERVVVDGRDFAKEVIGAAFGDEARETLMDNLSGGRKEPIGNLIQEIPQNILDNFIQSEHPQTIAFLLTKLTPDVSSGIISRMREDVQAEVMVRISQLENVKSEIVDEVREVIRTQLRGLSMGGEASTGGPKAAADILNFIDRTASARIMAEMEEGYPDLAVGIKSLMFTFEDCKKIDDRNIQTVLKEVSRDQLVVGLKNASDELKGLLLRNMSQRAAEMLKDDLDSLGPTPLKDVEKAQKAIVETVRKLEAEGKITIAGGGGDVMV